MKLAYSLREAADQTPYSVDTLRRAIAATDPKTFPPPLKAKRGGSERKPVYTIRHVDLVAWLDSLPDA